MKFAKLKLFAQHARRITMIQICACFMTVIGCAIACWYFSPEKMANREAERIAKDYYENYFYNNLFGELTDDTKQEIFEKYQKIGTPPTYLRHLLNFENGKHADSASYFRYPQYYCDVNASSVVFYPHEPYTSKDYTVKYFLICNDNT